MRRIWVVLILIALSLTSCKIEETQKLNVKENNSITDDLKMITDTEYGLEMPSLKENLEQFRYQLCLEKWKFDLELYSSFYNKSHSISIYYEERDYAQDSKAYQLVYVVEGKKKCEYYTLVYTCKGFLSYIENVGSGLNDVESVNDAFNGKFVYFGKGELLVTKEEVEDFEPNFEDAFNDKNIIKQIKNAVKKKMSKEYGIKCCEIYMMFMLPADQETKLYVKDHKGKYYKGDLKLLYSGKKLNCFVDVLYEKIKGPSKIVRDDEIIIEKSIKL